MSDGTERGPSPRVAVTSAYLAEVGADSLGADDDADTMRDGAIPARSVDAADMGAGAIEPGEAAPGLRALAAFGLDTLDIDPAALVDVLREAEPSVADLRRLRRSFASRHHPDLTQDPALRQRATSALAAVNAVLDDMIRNRHVCRPR